MFWDDLDGWDGERGSSSGRRYVDICLHVADSLCYTAEINTTLQNNYTLIIRNKKIIKVTYSGVPMFFLLIPGFLCFS